ASSTATTESDGSFAVVVPVRETTQVQAAAGAIHSDTQTIVVRSRTRVKARRMKGGTIALRGTVAPGLPGQALLLRVDSPAVVARSKVTGGSFAFRLAKARRSRGAFQVVYVPAGERALRSTSNTVRVPGKGRAK
ncbi:MAG TPA: hypothetical protein VMB05_08250, partial [Solirubrobacteraceae bacterium]|nr:hypothetical protein [Solirubrobacteraceae bacterium]